MRQRRQKAYANKDNFNRGLSLYVYPGEIFSVYGLNTKRNSHFKYNMVAENSNCLGGYIPVPEAFAENSELYEAELSYCSFAVP